MKDMKELRNWHIVALGALCLLTGCGNDNALQQDATDEATMSFSAIHPHQQAANTRVTDTAFETGDRVGLYITEKDVALEPSGNYVNNATLTCSGGSQWNTAVPVYWNNGSYDVYAYYPYTDWVSSINDYPFTVATDQSGTGYAESDFLWAGKKGVTATASPVSLPFSHRMSRLYIRLVKSEDYEGDLPDDAEVYIHNTVSQATIDLSMGIVTRSTHGTSQTIRAKSLGEHRYAAIIVPQRLENRQPLVEVIMKGVSYLYESKFVFKTGIQHTVQLAISQNPEQVRIDVGGEIGNWE